MIPQGTAYSVLFVLRDALQPQNAYTTAFPGNVITPGEIKVIKPGVAPANAAGVVANNGGGWYTYTLTVAETSLGLASGAAADIGLEINVSGAILMLAASWTVRNDVVPPTLAQMQAGLPTTAGIATAVAAAVPTLAEVNAAAAAGAATVIAGVPDSADLAAAGSATTAAVLAAVPAATAELVPNASQNAVAVSNILVDGVALDEALAVMLARLAGAATLPMGATGGPYSFLGRTGTVRLAGAISPSGDRTVTTFTGA